MEAFDLLVISALAKSLVVQQGTSGSPIQDHFFLQAEFWCGIGSNSVFLSW